MEQKGEPRIKTQDIQSTNIRQGGQGHPVRKRASLQKNYAWKTGETQCRMMKSDPYLTLLTKLTQNGSMT